MMRDTAGKLWQLPLQEASPEWETQAVYGEVAHSGINFRDNEKGTSHYNFSMTLFATIFPIKLPT